MAVKPTLAVLAALLLSAPAMSSEPLPDRLVLLGTAGGPAIRAHRAQIASLLEIGGKRFLIDCGEGCVTQLKKAGVEAAQVDGVFLTHIHLDHVAGLSSLGAFAWAGGKSVPITIHGPPGTSALVKQGLAQFAGSGAVFAAEVPGMGNVADIMQSIEHDVAGAEPVEIYRTPDLRITAIENSHLTHLAGKDFSFGKARSYALRFDTAQRSVVFTGDTGASPAVEALAKDADILVSEIMDVEGTMVMFRARHALTDAQAAQVEAQMRAKHLSPQDVAHLARTADVKLVVLSHDGAAGDETGNQGIEKLADQVRKLFSGTVVAGQDLQRF
jgi:ribonuclease BN (tRNA processing enzyme)